jgi:hypothetical protein
MNTIPENNIGRIVLEHCLIIIALKKGNTIPKRIDAAYLIKNKYELGGANSHFAKIRIYEKTHILPFCF